MYQALVVQVTVRKHPNADRLQIASCNGANVVVGLETQDNDIGLLFLPGGQLSVDFAASNNLVRIKNEDGTYSGGMFDENRRVRAMILRGVKSEGYYCPLDYLRNVPGISAASVDSLKVGMAFDTLDNVSICNKYYTLLEKQAIANRNNNSPAKKLINFPEHVDTEQYRFVKNLIPKGSIIHITEKLHGTSQRQSNLVVDRVLKWYEKLAQRFGIPVVDTEYKTVIGTRRTVLRDDNPNSFYGDETFRRNAAKGIALRKGEMIYSELVGYTTTGALIMSEQDTSKLKELVKRYGNVMRYTYGCMPMECKQFVYRITQDGVELSHFQVIKRCAELGLVPVPTLTTLVYDGNIEALDTLVEAFMYGCSTLDSSHIREGVVLRVENELVTQFIKSKSLDFGILEGYVSQTIIDRENVS